jgi:hypothetical protein
MRQPLLCHPHSDPSAITGVAVDIAPASPRQLSVTFHVSGRVDEMVLPQKAAPKRADELWRRTCFEVFMRSAPDEPYYEVNFSPSSQWAVYRFDRYREGMRAAPYSGDPGIVTKREGVQFALGASIDLLQLSALDLTKPLRFGLSAIIDETNGNKSYWAAAHPPGKPDFHHGDCFALNLSGSTR